MTEAALRTVPCGRELSFQLSKMLMLGILKMI